MFCQNRGFEMGRHRQGLHDVGWHILNRRRWLQISGIGWLSATLPSLIRPRQSCAGEGVSSPIKSCILVFFYGGPRQLETFDSKPDAPTGIPGEYQPISTA